MDEDNINRSMNDASFIVNSFEGIIIKIFFLCEKELKTYKFESKYQSKQFVKE